MIPFIDVDLTPTETQEALRDALTELRTAAMSALAAQCFNPAESIGLVLELVRLGQILQLQGREDTVDLLLCSCRSKRRTGLLLAAINELRVRGIVQQSTVILIEDVVNLDLGQAVVQLAATNNTGTCSTHHGSSRCSTGEVRARGPLPSSRSTARTPAESGACATG